ncbi:MAG: oligosaccharide flippase family protein [candidate division Zixibacteria bacterium]|nr:oligosaccharide flippase family protein [candidate division Zixibacteria bacterium]
MLGVGQQYIRNVYSSWLGHIARALITFFFVPYITSVFGDTRYGVWVIVFQAINYFSLLDIGLTSAITRYVSKYLAEKNLIKVNRVLNTSNLIYLVLGTVVMAGVYLFVTLFFDYFKIGNPELVEEGRNAMLIMGLFMAFNFYLLPFGNTLGAFQRYDIANGIRVIEEIIRVAVMIWLLSQGYGLVALALTLVALTVIKHIATAFWLLRLHPELRITPGLADKDTARTLFQYSRVSFGIVIGWLVIFNTDVFLLGLMSSSAAAGVYYPGVQLLNHVRNAINNIGTPLIPAVSQLNATSDPATIKNVYTKGLRYTSYLSFLLSTCVILYAQPFVTLWLSPEFAGAASVMTILAIGSAIFLPQIIGNSVLFGIEKHKYIFYVLICETVSKVLLALVLIKTYGILGMALASAIPQVVFYLTLYPYFMGKVLSASPGRLVWSGLKHGLFAVIVSCPLALAFRYLLPPVTWVTLIANVGMVLIVTLIIGYRIVLEPGDRQRLLRGFR